MTFFLLKDIGVNYFVNQQLKNLFVPSKQQFKLLIEENIQNEYQLQQVLCQKNNQSKPVIITVFESIFPNLKNQFHFIAMEYSLQFTTLKNSRFDILCYVKLSKTQILPLILELKFVSFQNEHLKQILNYIHELDTFIAAKQHFYKFNCSTYEILEPIGFLLFPTFPNTTQSNLQELQLFLNKSKRNICLLQFELQQNIKHQSNQGEAPSKDFLNISYDIQSSNTDLYTREQCISRANELLQQNPNLKSVLKFQTCKELCALDNKFPPAEIWCQYYDVNNLDELLDWYDEDL